MTAISTCSTLKPTISLRVSVSVQPSADSGRPVSVTIDPGCRWCPTANPRSSTIQATPQHRGHVQTGQSRTGALIWAMTPRAAPFATDLCTTATRSNSTAADSADEIPIVDDESVAPSNALLKEGSRSSVPRQCTRSWKLSGSSTRFCCTATVGGVRVSGLSRSREHLSAAERRSLDSDGFILARRMLLGTSSGMFKNPYVSCAAATRLVYPAAPP
ncbi:hypothetical protein R69927_07182 [Paraburkholderia domus]|nr:hypothetical protein R69927_07182 [Paraburkholderia domus]